MLVWCVCLRLVACNRLVGCSALGSLRWCARHSQVGRYSHGWCVCRPELVVVVGGGGSSGCVRAASLSACVCGLSAGRASLGCAEARVLRRPCTCHAQSATGAAPRPHLWRHLAARAHLYSAPLSAADWLQWQGQDLEIQTQI